MEIGELAKFLEMKKTEKKKAQLLALKKYERQLILKTKKK
jgi:hypothetical protein